MEATNIAEGERAFFYMALSLASHGSYDQHRAAAAQIPHPDFPVSKKSGSKFEEKEND